MGFKDAVTTCYQKYATFTGRASRSEYWFFALWNLLIYIVLYIAMMITPILGMLVMLALLANLVPGIAVAIRKMHDTGRSGWWLFCPIMPIYWFCIRGTVGNNQFGPDPVQG